jgi:hypothetical protein
LAFLWPRGGKQIDGKILLDVSVCKALEWPQPANSAATQATQPRSTVPHTWYATLCNSGPRYKGRHPGCFFPLPVPYAESTVVPGSRPSVEGWPSC